MKKLILIAIVTGSINAAGPISSSVELMKGIKNGAVATTATINDNRNKVQKHWILVMKEDLKKSKHYFKEVKNLFFKLEPIEEYNRNI